MSRLGADRTPKGKNLYMIACVVILCDISKGDTGVVDERETYEHAMGFKMRSGNLFFPSHVCACVHVYIKIPTVFPRPIPWRSRVTHMGV